MESRVIFFISLGNTSLLSWATSGKLGSLPPSDTSFFSECKHPNLYSSTLHICTDNNTCTHLRHSVIQANLLETENCTQLPTRTHAHTHASTQTCTLSNFSQCHVFLNGLITILRIISNRSPTSLIFHFFAQCRCIKRKPLPHKQSCFKGVYLVVTIFSPTVKTDRVGPQWVSGFSRG